jgi:hypothetical protein
MQIDVVKHSIRLIAIPAHVHPVCLHAEVRVLLSLKTMKDMSVLSAIQQYYALVHLPMA